MTKKEIVEWFWIKLNGGRYDTDIMKKYPRPYIEKIIEMALDAAMANVLNDYKNYDFYGKWYNNVSVSVGASGFYYSDLPIKAPQLKLRNQVIKITATEDFDSLEFLWADVQSSSALNRGGTTARNGIIPYNTHNNMVTYYVNPDRDYVRMFLVTPFSELDDDDPFNIPAGQEDFVLTFVIKHLQTIVDPDTNNAKAEI
jgi:hypothetical protein